MLIIRCCSINLMPLSASHWLMTLVLLWIQFYKWTPEIQWGHTFCLRSQGLVSERVWKAEPELFATMPGGPMSPYSHGNGDLSNWRRGPGSQGSKVAVLSTLRCIMPSFPSLSKFGEEKPETRQELRFPAFKSINFFQDKFRQVMVKVREDRE